MIKENNYNSDNTLRMIISIMLLYVGVQSMVAAVFCIIFGLISSEPGIDGAVGRYSFVEAMGRTSLTSVSVWVAIAFILLAIVLWLPEIIRKMRVKA